MFGQVGSVVIVCVNTYVRVSVRSLVLPQTACQRTATLPFGAGEIDVIPAVTVLW